MEKNNMTQQAGIAKIEIPDDYIFQKYPGQVRAQEIRLCINGDERTVEFDTEPLGGGYTTDQFHHRELLFTLSGDYLPVSEAKNLLESIGDLLNPLLKSYDSRYDGQNYVGKWNDDLVEQIENIVAGFSITIEKSEDLPAEMYAYFFGEFDEEEDEDEDEEEEDEEDV